MADVEYPADLPCIQQTNFAFQPVSPVLRDTMTSGRARQRRLYASTPSMVTVEWLCSDAEAVALEAFYNQTLNGGVDWFTMAIRTPYGSEARRVRFTDIYQGPSLEQGRYWRYTATLELETRLGIEPSTMSGRATGTGYQMTDDLFGMLNDLLNRLLGDFPQIRDALQPILDSAQQALAGVEKALGNWGGQLRKALQDANDQLNEALGDVGARLAEFEKNAVDSINKALGNAQKAIQNFRKQAGVQASALEKRLREFVFEAQKQLKAAAGTVGSQAQSIINSLLSTLRSLIP